MTKEEIIKLYEAAEKAYTFEADPNLLDEKEHSDFLRIFKKGANWQQERMYSEEDLRQAYRDGMSSVDCREDVGLFCIQKEEEWFKQFKKIKTK